MIDDACLQAAALASLPLLPPRSRGRCRRRVVIAIVHNLNMKKRAKFCCAYTVITRKKNFYVFQKTLLPEGADLDPDADETLLPFFLLSLEICNWPGLQAPITSNSWG